MSGDFDILVVQKNGLGKCAKLITLMAPTMSIRIFRNEILIIRFLDDQGLLQTSLELYTEKEFEHLLGRLVESLVYQVVWGYERAMSDAVHAMSIACQTLLPHSKEIRK